MPGLSAGLTVAQLAPDEGVSEDAGIPGLKPERAGCPLLPVWTALPVSSAGITSEPSELTPQPRQVAGEQRAGEGTRGHRALGHTPRGSHSPGKWHQTDFKGTSNCSLKAPTGPFNYSKSHLGAAC